MKSLLNILVYVLAGFGAYTLITQHWPAADSAVVTPAVNSTSDASSETALTCPTCQGEGRLTYVDRRGKNHSYGCPVCGFSGMTKVKIPAGGHLCADCKGMGRTEIKTTRGDIVGYVIEASRCQRCNSTGWILPRTAPGSKQPTRYVDPPSPAR